MTVIKGLTKQHPVLAFYIMTFVISWGGGLIVLGLDGFVGARQLSQTQFLAGVLVGIAGPTTACILLTGLISGRAGFRELRSRLSNWRVGAHWYAVALLTGPLLTVAIIFGLSQLSSAFLPGILFSNHKATLVLIGLVAGFAAGFFEELGWSGFATPQLRLRHGLLSTGVIMGFLWGLWHFPVFSGQAGASVGLPPVLYLSMLLFSFLPPFRVLLVWVYDRTQSLPVVMLMHGVLSAAKMIFQSQGTGIDVVIHLLIFSAVLWIFAAIVAVANDGQLFPKPLQKRTS